MAEILLARVKVQRDNGPNEPYVVGMWVAASGFTPSIEEAKIYTSESAIRGDCPRQWEFEVVRFASLADTFTISKE